MMHIALTYAIIACLIFILVETRMKNPLFAIFLKAFASLGFIIVFAASLYQLLQDNMIDQSFVDGRSDLLKATLFILLGLSSGFMGDLVLALRPLQSREKDKTVIIYGIISFSLGHVFYLLALFSISNFGIFSVVLGLVMTLIMIIMSKVLGFEMGIAKVPSFMYAFLIFMMVGQTLLLGNQQSYGTFSLLFIAGAVLFAMSDLILSPIYFKQMNQKWMIAMNLITYYGAQILIAASVFYLF